jgi:DNA-binding beta-propeller fold protein YncE
MWVAPAVALLLLLIGTPCDAQSDSFVAFETVATRPLALSPDGSRLFALNTPDARLEILAIDGARLRRVGSVPVGLEPVALAVRNAREVWVVNHLSDSVSIVDVSGAAPRVVRTLLVGDEPGDIVFAGPGRRRAFISAAHRGQNTPWPRGDYQQPGIGRADVWVFDARELGDSLGGEPIAVLTLFGDKPRALAVSPDGKRVYASVFKSGNRTTIVPSWAICRGGSQAPPCEVRGSTYPGGLPAPNSNVENVPSPPAGLIVRYDAASEHWLDELGRSWNEAVRFELPDLDVFEIDATASPPRQQRAWSDVGTVLFQLAVNPATGSVYVANTDAANDVRFEGGGVLAGLAKPPGEPATVRGRFLSTRISVLRGASALPRPLNDHIDYDVVPSPDGTKERSLATPAGMAVSADGRRLYLAALGSDTVAEIDTRALESGAPLSAARRHIAVPGGPSGVVLDPERNRLYVLTRFDDAVVAVDIRAKKEVQRVALFNPEPESLVRGRRFLYDARATSSNGEASCAGCHIFGDTDELAWDLGDPDGVLTPNPNPDIFAVRRFPPFHPMKGPMATQSLRGMARNGPMHWRGDRTGGNATPPGDPLDEQLAFEAFDVAIPGLLGREAKLAPEAMSAFAEFALQLTYPPSPIRRLDNALRSDEDAGRKVFFETSTFNNDPTVQCQHCHRLDPENGFFGTQGLSDEIKIPHLRNLYQKVGMFGVPTPALIFGEDPFLGRGSYAPTGPQIRGFGFTHAGEMDTLARFVSQFTFLLPDGDIRNLEAFLIAFDSDLAPIVGQQVTLSRDSGETAHRRVDLLAQRAATPRPFRGAPAGECDLIAKGVALREARGWVRTADGRFRSDRAREKLWRESDLRALARHPRQELTFTCVPPGSGVRMGIDRDEDGVLDGDERR